MTPRPSRKPSWAGRAAAAVGALTLTCILVAPAHGAVTPAVGTPAGPAGVVGNGYIAFTTDRDGRSEIYRMGPDGSLLQNLTNDAAARDGDPAWSPDGTRIAFTSDRDGNDEIYVMNADGSGQTNLSSSPASDSQPTWSPDGTRIAFTSDRDGNDEIYVMNADGSGQTNLTVAPASDSQPAWSPDGGVIAFSSDRDGNREIYVESVDGGGEATDLTQNAASDSGASWSPDGTRIAFTSDRDGNDEVYVMAADGSSQTDMTNDPASDSGPVFSPEDATRIAFTSRRDGNAEIYYMRDAVGAGQHDLTTSDAKDFGPSWQPLRASPPATTPVQHVVVLFMENQSFDSVLGALCVHDRRCDGARTGEISTGETVRLAQGRHVVPAVGHSYRAQLTAMDGGLMDGFDQVQGCSVQRGYACYQTYTPNQIPTIADLARTFAVSDRTFPPDVESSWGAHFVLAASQMDGFYSGDHHRVHGYRGPGWGCDSFMVGPWGPTFAEFEATPVDYPTCVPQQDGSGPFLPSDVPWVPTIMDRMDQAGLPWRIYAPSTDELIYGWAMCPTFADCLYTPQSANVREPSQFVTDVRNGDLASLSIVVPLAEDSQHNKAIMLQGDNWIGAQVQAVMDSPEWASTTIFVTWDDCGCFYDHVPPPPGEGLREPMIVISPYAKAGFTDSRHATFNSMLAYTERVFGLTPLGVRDAEEYAYDDVFDYSQAPRPPIVLPQHRIPASDVEWLREHPLDPDDPT